MKSINSVSLKLITYLNAQRVNADTKRLTELKESAVRDKMELTINLYTISMISSYFVYNIKNVIIFITNLMCAYFFESFLMINVIQPKISFSINRLFISKIILRLNHNFAGNIFVGLGLPPCNDPSTQKHRVVLMSV